MTSLDTVARTDVSTLVDRYDALLIDAYGVLVHRDGAFPGASAFIEHLESQDKPYHILTNDASRNSVSASQSYMSKGIEIPPEKIITSGSLIGAYFAEHNLAGARCVVLGTKDSKQFVLDAGGEVLSPFEAEDVDVILVCDDAGFPFLEAVEAVMSLLFRRFDQGLSTHMVLPNPDLIYQKNEAEYGLTSGSIALILEQALELRYLHNQFQFARLGKPYLPIFEQALRRTNTRNMVMLGDQLRTDIAGANAFGIDSALVTTGLVQVQTKELQPMWRPTFLLENLSF
jgi:HAD superfamily hydrolase (TIGR01450 family)